MMIKCYAIATALCLCICAASVDGPDPNPSLEIMSAKIVVSRQGTKISMEIGNSGDQVVKLRKGGLRVFSEISKEEKLLTFLIEDEVFHTGGFHLVFSPCELNVIEMKKMEYTQLDISQGSFGANFGATEQEILDCVKNDFEVALKYAIKDQSGQTQHWRGEVTLLDNQADLDLFVNFDEESR